MTLTTRQPTGKPSWPILLIAGAEKAGKSWACAEASGSELVGRTLWIGAGEDDPDEYGNVPGASFEIVVHDGTYRGILAAITDAAAEPAGDKPTLLVVDSMTRVWDLLCDDAQEAANRRAIAKARKYNKPVPDEDVQITMDLWNTAKQRWAHIVDALREHRGPVLVTARLEQVTVLDSKGAPTTEKTWKVKAEKSLPYDVGGIVELPARGEAWLTGVRSVRMALAERTRLPKFAVADLWRRMGLGEVEAGPRTHQQVTREVADDEPAAPVASVKSPKGDLAAARKELMDAYPGMPAPEVMALVAAALGKPAMDCTAEELRGYLAGVAEKAAA